jgi:hypothetical protein
MTSNISLLQPLLTAIPDVTYLSLGDIVSFVLTKLLQYQKISESSCNKNSTDCPCSHHLPATEEMAFSILAKPFLAL